MVKYSRPKEKYKVRLPGKKIQVRFAENVEIYPSVLFTTFSPNLVHFVSGMTAASLCLQISKLLISVMNSRLIHTTTVRQIRSFEVASSEHCTNCTVQFFPILGYKFSTDHGGLHTWACWPAKIVGHVRKGSPFIFLFSLVYTRKTTRPGNVQHKFPAHWKGLLLITLPFCTLCSVFQA